MHSANKCVREGSEEMFQLSAMGVGQLKGKRRAYSRQGGQQVQRSNTERDVKHLETERTVRPGLKPG